MYKYQWLVASKAMSFRIIASNTSWNELLKTWLDDSQRWTVILLCIHGNWLGFRNVQQAQLSWTSLAFASPLARYLDVDLTLRPTTFHQLPMPKDKHKRHRLRVVVILVQHSLSRVNSPERVKWSWTSNDIHFLAKHYSNLPDIEIPSFICPRFIYQPHGEH